MKIHVKEIRYQKYKQFLLISFFISLIVLRSTSVEADSKWPERYDPRQNTILPTIKNQGNANNCWGFALASAIEMNVMRGYQTNIKIDPTYMIQSHGFDLGDNRGGSLNMSIAYLSRGGYLGNDFTDYVLSSVNYLDKDSKTRRETLKQAVLEQGAVYANIKWDKSNFNELTAGYYNKSALKGVDHALVVIGWDDHYKKSNFLQPPPEDGAYICKNSWGEKYGDRGYIYVSYSDFMIKENTATIVVEKSDKKERIYQHDYLGKTEELGYGQPVAWMSNVYQMVGEKEKLSAISFYTLEKETKYEAWIVRQFNDAEDFKGKTKIATGRCKNEGYHRVLLNKMLLDSKEKIAIILRLESPSIREPIAVESPILGYSSKASALENESYISPDGHLWQDLYTLKKDTNNCLKLWTSTSK